MPFFVPPERELVSRADDMSDAENFSGGFYELVLVLGPTDDARLDGALKSLWRAAGVRGCRAHGVDGAGPVDVELGVRSLEEHGHLLATLTLASGDRVVCGGLAFRCDGADQVELYLPLGALARVEPRVGAYPFGADGGPRSLSWRAPLDRWLAGVAAAVYADVPFQRALVGFEVDEDEDGERYAAVLAPVPGGGWDYRPATA